MKFYKLSGIGYPVKIHKFYILLFALCFYNIAYGQNQPITVSMKNQPLLKVFEISTPFFLSIGLLSYLGVNKLRECSRLRLYSLCFLWFWSRYS